jgi:DNA-binding NarL/FixJ family response regulator
MAAGPSNGSIAHRLHVSQATVKSHVAHVLMKLSARDLPAASGGRTLVPGNSPARRWWHRKTRHHEEIP